MSKKTYAEKKAEARETAEFWNDYVILRSFTSIDGLPYDEFMYQLGKRYGLLREFKENGII